MVLKIRLARLGHRNKPFYNIVVAQARSARDSKPLEVLGTYDPIPKPIPASESPFNTPPTSSPSSKSVSSSSSPAPTLPSENDVSAPKPKPFKDIKLDLSRTKYWLGVGAQPSEPAWRLLAMIGLLEPRMHAQRMRTTKEQLERKMREEVRLEG